MAQSYKVILWKTDGSEQEIIFDKKPAWEKIYPLINAELIQICKGFITGFSNRSFEMLTDEESKYNNKERNERATVAWYNWQVRTGHACIIGDYIAGDIAIVQKVA